MKTSEASSAICTKSSWKVVILGVSRGSNILSECHESRGSNRRHLCCQDFYVFLQLRTCLILARYRGSTTSNPDLARLKRILILKVPFVCSDCCVELCLCAIVTKLNSVVRRISARALHKAKVSLVSFRSCIINPPSLRTSLSLKQASRAFLHITHSLFLSLRPLASSNPSSRGKRS